MPVLSNPKHERFSQELAKGVSQREAYRTAGYNGSDAVVDAGASRLVSGDKVQARVTELQARAAARTEISVAGITSKLIAIAEKAEAGKDAPSWSVARAAYMDAAKLNGLVVDKVQADVTNRDARPDELDDDTLAHIAGAGRDGAAAKANGKARPDRVH